MKAFPLLPCLATLVLCVSCKKEPAETVVVTGDGKVTAVPAADATTPDKVVVVRDSSLIWPSAEAAVKSQIQATNNEDLDGFMSYIHPDSPDFPDARARAAKVFADNDLRTTLESLEPDSVTEGEVKARFVQRTEKLSGLPFRNNRVSGIHILRRDGAMWKIYSTRTDKVDYLDASP